MYRFLAQTTLGIAVAMERRHTPLSEKIAKLKIVSSIIMRASAIIVFYHQKISP
jgi:hypothetical protein